MLTCWAGESDSRRERRKSEAQGASPGQADVKTEPRWGRKKMEQLPKIVQQRLRAAAKAGVHPDPDLLTAFAEKSLNDREHAQLLQHLAECANCRDVLALAMPEIQPALVPGPQRSNRVSWPVLRWGALAACVVVVSTVVTLHYERQEPTRSVAEKAPVSPAEIRPEGEVSGQPAQKLAANLPPPAPAQFSRDFGAAGKLAKQGAKSTDAGMMAKAAGAPALELEQDKKVQELGNNRLAGVDAVRLADKPESPAPAAPEPSAASQVNAQNDALDYSSRASSEMVTVEGAAAPTRQVAAQTAERKAKDESGTNESHGEVQAEGGIVSATVLGDRKADTFSGASAQAASTERAGRLRAVKHSPLWTLSATGALQRSFDSGKTWQAIPVASDVVFRALAANDSDIWVGGAAGALYHSSDGGQHWTRITPVAAGKSLTADIVTVEFGDLQHGKVVTVNGETWTTSDAGETWQHQ